MGITPTCPVCQSTDSRRIPVGISGGTMHKCNACSALYAVVAADRAGNFAAEWHATGTLLIP